LLSIKEYEQQPNAQETIIANELYKQKVIGIMKEDLLKD
jgi:hypothetical protein